MTEAGVDELVVGFTDPSNRSELEERDRDVVFLVVMSRNQAQSYLGLMASFLFRSTPIWVRTS